MTEETLTKATARVTECICPGLVTQLHRNGPIFLPGLYQQYFVKSHWPHRKPVHTRNGRIIFPLWDSAVTSESGGHMLHR